MTHEEELQEALSIFQTKYGWYRLRLERRMKLYEFDFQDVQGAWNRYLRLRKQSGNPS